MRKPKAEVGAKTRVRGINLPWEGENWASTLSSPGRHPGKSCGYGKTASGVPEGFLYENQLRPVAWLDGTGTVVARFVYGTRINVPEYMVTSTATYRIVTDHLGSPRLVVDTSSGTVAQRVDYDEWGIVVADSNPGFQPFGFAGGLYDRDTGLVRFGARDYDAVVGRWANKDPIRFGGGLNFYEYAGSNPVDFTDPWGLALIPVNLPGLGNTYLDDAFYPLVQAWIANAAAQGVTLHFNEAYRTPQYQQSLQSNPNAITPAQNSLHSCGYAADVQYGSLQNIPGGLTGNQQRQIIRDTAATAGLSWGGNFTNPGPDPPHFYNDPGFARPPRIAQAYSEYLILTGQASP